MAEDKTSTSCAVMSVDPLGRVGVLDVVINLQNSIVVNPAPQFAA